MTERTRTARVVLRPLPLGLLAAILTIVPAALATGAADPLELADAGAAVRWGLPVVDAVANIVSVTVVGLLGLAAFVVPERRHTDRRGAAVRTAGLLAAVWVVLGALQVVLRFADIAGSPLSTPGLLEQVVTFAWQLEVTRVISIGALCALGVAVGALFARGRGSVAWLSVVALFGVVVQALIGHAAGSASHADAVNGLAIHLLAVTLWVGGLVGLVILRPRLGSDLGTSVARFSVVATWSFVAVGLSGLLQAWIRIGSPSGLFTGYAALVAAKTLLFVGLGWLGWRQRKVLARRLVADPLDGRAFRRLAFGEVVLMGLAMGFAAVFSRSEPPVPDALPDPSNVLSLTDYPDPGPLTAADWILAWRTDWLFLTVTVLAVAVYLGGVRRLHRRGDPWPVLRSVLWVAGWVVFLWATCGAPGIWGRVLFSMHMVMHMAVAMIVPLLLVPAAPVTLALRTLAARKDRTWGPREVVLQVVHSRALRVLANPVVAASLFFFSLAAFYFSPLFFTALTTHTGHLLMMAHFLLTGYLFVYVMIGTDPGPPKWSPLMLLVILFATVSFHAFFGVVVTGSQELLAGNFWRALELPWGPELLADQRLAGEIAWGVGEAPTLVLAVLVAVHWFRAETRRAVRSDRQADRDGDAELRAYNAHLARLRSEAERLKGTSR
ncbi:cytochrome c oxidase assembly protein [Phycicoccus jejuensis]|uniref:cytochrome c oxidase assembly protein n=1 Tax=Phycicoccus jejuensis TaxID=367299 RepID=UPI00384F82CD